MGQSRGELPLLLLINRRRREGEGGAKFWRERRAVTEREARPSRVKEQKTEAKRKKQRGKTFGKKRRTETGGSLHRGEEGPFLTTWAPPLCFLFAATTAPSSCHHQRCQRQQNQRGRRETEQKQRTTLRREGEPPSKQLPQFPDCHQHHELSVAQPRQREEDIVDRDNTHWEEEKTTAAAAVPLPRHCDPLRTGGRPHIHCREGRNLVDRENQRQRKKPAHRSRKTAASATTAATAGTTPARPPPS
jgi:hypothetical protein